MSSSSYHYQRLLDLEERFLEIDKRVADLEFENEKGLSPLVKDLTLLALNSLGSFRNSMNSGDWQDIAKQARSKLVTE
jgi:hypothetical protein